MPALSRVAVSTHALRVAAANRRLRLVQLARLASVTGRWSYAVTLAVLAYRVGGAAGVAVAGLVKLGPSALVAPFAGALIQRVRPARLLLGGGLARTLVLMGAGAVILTGGSMATVYALVAFESGLSTLIRPAQNALLPALARTPQELTSTNLALSVMESAGALLGPLAGAALLHLTDAGIVFLASGVAYLVSTLLLLPVGMSETAPFESSAGSRFLFDAASGVRAVASDRDTSIVVFLYGAQNLLAGALNVLVVVTALRLLGMAQSGVGTLTAAVGVGGVVGGALVSARMRKRRHGLDLAIGLVLWGAPLVLLSILSSRPAAFVLLGIVGVGVTVVDVAAVTLLQRTARGDLLPHALSLLQTVFVVSVGLGTLLAPSLVSALGVRGALLTVGLPLPLLAFALAQRLRRIDRYATTDPARVGLLAHISIFSPLSQAVLEHLASALRPLALDAEETVFHQGDDGDDFYVVEEGEVEVVNSNGRIATLGPGDYFGEIALLRNVPRTATIRTLSPVRLLLLDRGRFIGTVIGNTASSNAADAIVAARVPLRAGLSSL